MATHKHRNLIDDILDAALALGAIGYFLLSDTLDVHLTDKTIALMATAGATLRGTVRRVMMRLWSDELGISEGADNTQSESLDSAPDSGET